LAGYGHGQTRVEGGDSADAGGLRGGVALTHDDVGDEFGVESRPAHQLSDNGGGEFVGGDVPELAAEGSDRGPQRLANDDVLVHGSSTSRPPASCGPVCPRCSLSRDDRMAAIDLIHQESRCGCPRPWRGRPGSRARMSRTLVWVSPTLARARRTQVSAPRSASGSQTVSTAPLNRSPSSPRPCTSTAPPSRRIACTTSDSPTPRVPVC